MAPQSRSKPADANDLVRRHVCFGWWALLCFVALGIVLELMHGFKVGWYLEPAFETRRLMWTLGHAHGTLLAVLNIVFGVSMHVVVGRLKGRDRWASPCLMGATILLPGGFFAGGLLTYQGDPGVGIVLVPVGAFFLFVGVLLAGLSVSKIAVQHDETDAKPETPRAKRRGKS